MKKTIVMLAAVMLVLAVSLSAVAEEEAKPWTFSGTGITLANPERFSQTQGMIYPMDFGEMDADQKIAFSFIGYIPVSEEDRALITQLQNETNLTDEQKALLTEILGKLVPLYRFYSVGNGKSFEDVRETIFQSESPDIYNLFELGQAEEYRFYLLALKPESEEVKSSVESFPENCREEFIDLLKDTDTLISSITVQEPVKAGAESVGTVFSFELNDFSGKSVRSEDLFAGHKVTLVNLWASWCGPCAAEMPELEALWQEYGAKGAGFVGICLDGYKEKCLADAKAVAAEGGVTYPMLACTKELEQNLLGSVVTVYPTTVFVNERGEIIGEPIIGVQPSAYRTALDQFLSE